MSRIIIFVILNKNKYQIDAHNICHRHSHSYLYFGCVIVLSFRLGFFDVQTFMSLFGLGFVVCVQLLGALSSLRGLRGAPAVPPLCRETQSLGQQMLNATVGING